MYKNGHFPSGMQFFVLFWIVVRGATQGVGSVKKLTLPKRNASYCVNLDCRLSHKVSVEAVAAHPAASGSEAAARAAAAVGRNQSKLESRTGIHVIRRIWAGVKPVKKTKTKNKGGRPSLTMNPKLRPLIHAFLMRHSKETSCFCRTKLRDQKARSHIFLTNC